MSDGTTPVAAARRGVFTCRPVGHPAVLGVLILLLFETKLLTRVGFLAGRDLVELDFVLGNLFPLEGGLDGEGELFGVLVLVCVAICVAVRIPLRRRPGGQTGDGQQYCGEKFHDNDWTLSKATWFRKGSGGSASLFYFRL